MEKGSADVKDDDMGLEDDDDDRCAPPIGPPKARAGGARACQGWRSNLVGVLWGGRDRTFDGGAVSTHAVPSIGEVCSSGRCPRR